MGPDRRIGLHVDDHLSPRWYAAVAISVLLAFLRLAGIRHEAFQAVAHLWVGALLYAAVVDRVRAAMWLEGALIVVELAAVAYYGLS
jgi:hypothetical protein